MDPENMSGLALLLSNPPPRGIREFIPLQGPRRQECDENAQTQLFVLCAKCKALETRLQELPECTEKLGFYEYTEHYESADLLRDSFKRGCHLCTLIWHSFTKRSPGEKYETLDSDEDWHNIKHEAITIIMRSGGGYPAIQPEFASGSSHASSRPTINIEIKPLRRHTLPFPLPTTPLSPVSTNAASCRSFYRACKENCDRTHTRCHMRLNKTRELPARLLRLTPASGGSSIATGTAPCVQLVPTRGNGFELPADTEFAALSYCWGKSHGLRLEKSNYQSLIAGIPFDQLPATIQDSILVTIELGLQYLWVDALCIIQDLSEDWSHDVARMWSVYQGCSIAIAASGASDSREGLFAARDPLQLAPCILANVAAAHFWETSPWHLETRGWVVQEQLLPARSIKFGSYISWECMELSTNEFGLDVTLIKTDLPRTLSSLVLEPEKTGPFDTFQFRDIWCEIITGFMEAKLSDKSDRLAAIAGLSSAIQRRTDWEWVCGLWRPFLLRELLWFRKDDHIEPTGLGPSWSWASYNGGTVLRDGEPGRPGGWTEVAEVIRVSYGSGEQVKFLPAELELSGGLYRIHKQNGRDGEYLAVEGWRKIILATFDEKDRPWMDDEMALPLGISEGLLLGHAFCGGFTLTGLIVVPTRGRTAFKRVGVFMLHSIVMKLEDNMKLLYGSDGKPLAHRMVLLV
ncbi:hypothetical protein VMCG_09423 [Cytospora schulzeri]|uniref:Heterokaryon incompatibility domain-containing protein n=1 Tax=Cytospora schulzeri TaxID=448051 RepID=A0A423VKK3_9PEZI|nr:hypothetical protein VMCG_09423 [Valsa malicola]